MSALAFYFKVIRALEAIDALSDYPTNDYPTNDSLTNDYRTKDYATLK